MTGDTIVAVASPPGRAPRGLLRASGPDAIPVLARVAEAASPAAWPSHQLRRTALVLPPAVPARVAVFGDGASFTGEPAFEAQVPGHPALLERLLERFRAAGARFAEPGEFSFRALLAGRLDLTQAEGLAASIAAESDAELDAARRLRGGELGRHAGEAVDRIAALLARVEAEIDFADEEDVVAVEPETLRAAASELRAGLEDLLARSRRWDAVEAPPRVVLVGAPSAGKSSLFNALLGHRRALVRPESGTTRDVLTETVRLGGATKGLEIRLSDIAGLDAPRTALDRAAQRAAADAIEAADLLVAVEPAAVDAGPGSWHASKPVLAVATKADLAAPAGRAIPVSARTGAGIEALEKAIAERVSSGRAEAPRALTLRARHVEQIETALEALRAVEAAPKEDPELTAAALREALDALAALGGSTSRDDVLGRVFATFCIGK